MRPLGAGPDLGGDPGEQEDRAQELSQGAKEQEAGREVDVITRAGDSGVKQIVERAGEKSFHCCFNELLGG